MRTYSIGHQGTERKQNTYGLHYTERFNRRSFSSFAFFQFT